MKLSQYYPKAVLVAVVATQFPIPPTQLARGSGSGPQEFGQPVRTASEPARGVSPGRPQQNDGIDRFFAGRILPSAGPQLHGSKVPLLDALEKSGYVYLRAGEGVWKIPAISRRIKAFEIRVSSVKDSVTLTAAIMDRKNLEVNGAFTRKITEMNRRFKPSMIELSKDMLSVRTDIGPQPVDVSDLVSTVERIVNVADEVYAEAQQFISPVPLVPPPPRTNLKEEPALLRMNEVDSKPVPLNRPKPSYTEEARRHSVEGVVLVRVFINEDGFVKNAVVLRGLPDGLDGEALFAVYQLRFKPALKDGRPVRCLSTVEIEFKLAKEK